MKGASEDHNSDTKPKMTTLLRCHRGRGEEAMLTGQFHISNLVEIKKHRDAIQVIYKKRCVMARGSLGFPNTRRRRRFVASTTYRWIPLLASK